MAPISLALPEEVIDPLDESDDEDEYEDGEWYYPQPIAA
jgi:hypothetical protein